MLVNILCATSLGKNFIYFLPFQYGKTYIEILRSMTENEYSNGENKSEFVSRY